MNTVANRTNLYGRGFSLIELLIVVAILAVLAAVIAPQFSGSTTEAQESALRSNLSSLRTAIAMYHREHNNTYPGVLTSLGGVCSGTAGSGTPGVAAAFIDQLTMFSNAAGLTCTAKDAGYDFGPYLPAGIPTNSVNGKSSVEMALAGNLNMTGNDSDGWTFDYTIGKIIVDTNAYANW